MRYLGGRAADVGDEVDRRPLEGEGQERGFVLKGTISVTTCERMGGRVCQGLRGWQRDREDSVFGVLWIDMAQNGHSTLRLSE